MSCEWRRLLEMDSDEGRRVTLPDDARGNCLILQFQFERGGLLDDVSSWLFFNAWPIADIPAWNVLPMESRWDFGCPHSITWLIVSELQ